VADPQRLPPKPLGGELDSTG